MTDRRIPFNITLPPSDTPLLNLVRRDRGSLSEFVHECLEAYGRARGEKGSKLTDLELEIAQLKARIVKSESELKTTKQARDLDASLLKELEVQLAEEASRLEGVKQQKIATTPTELVEAHWHLLPPAGVARTNKLRDLADAYQLDRREVLREAGKRHKLEAEKQTNLRALPAPRAKPSFGKAVDEVVAPKTRDESAPDCERAALVLQARPSAGGESDG